MNNANVLDDRDFCSWLSGFVDGEGCFAMYFMKHRDKNGMVKGRSTYLTFQIALRADDSKILHYIQSKLSAGRIQYDPKNGGGNPQTKFVLCRINDLHDVLLPLFRKYPLKTKKRLDFELFAEAVEFAYKNFHKKKVGIPGKRGYAPYPQGYWDRMDQLRKELKEIKRYNSTRNMYIK